MTELLFITRIIYGLYLILLGVFGILLSFLLAISKRENEIYLFLLLRILYNNGFDDVLLEPLRIRSLEPRNIEEFSKFSLQVCEPSNSHLSKLLLGEFVEKPQISLHLFRDQKAYYTYELYCRSSD